MIKINLQFFAPFFLILCCCHIFSSFLFWFLYTSARFLVLEALLIKIQVFGDITLCRFVYVVEPQYQIHLGIDFCTLNQEKS